MVILKNIALFDSSDDDMVQGPMGHPCGLFLAKFGTYYMEKRKKA
jgi:hypothetical protein